METLSLTVTELYFERTSATSVQLGFANTCLHASVYLPLGHSFRNMRNEKMSNYVSK